MFNSYKSLLFFTLGLLCVCKANISPAPGFSAIEDARKLFKAIDGWGTNEANIIDVLTNRSLKQRLEIKRVYPSIANGKSLEEDLTGDISGNFLVTMLALLQPLPEYYARQLANAGEKSEIVTDIIIDSTPSEITEINNAYTRLRINPDVTLPTLLVRHRQLITHKMIRKAFNGGRSQDQRVNEVDAHRDAYLLVVGTVEQVEEIFTERSYKQLERIFQIFEEKTKTFVEDAFTYREYPFALETSILDIIRYSKSKHEYFARRLYDSMHGTGTNDKMLIRILVSRSEIDLTQIKESFESLYGQSLTSYIKDDTSGDYGTSLLKIAEHN